ncbi:unnamed protein product [Polarella glacialis]|uniref:Uncharacterized protein n=1 Tax=Polarella glacialis TaxID=89957 RepID=A0A813ETK5_POLGL|nr:unnamed protein product [Polarella glacialis]
MYSRWPNGSNFKFACISVKCSCMRGRYLQTSWLHFAKCRLLPANARVPPVGYSRVQRTSKVDSAFDTLPSLKVDLQATVLRSSFSGEVLSGRSTFNEICFQGPECSSSNLLE